MRSGEATFRLSPPQQAATPWHGLDRCRPCQQGITEPASLPPLHKQEAGSSPYTRVHRPHQAEWAQRGFSQRSPPLPPRRLHHLVPFIFGNKWERHRACTPV